MYAIVKISEEQIKVAPQKHCYTAKLPYAVGSQVTFKDVMLVEDDEGPVFAPALKEAKVTAKVVQHCKGDKVIVFKKKRRKGYKVKQGHRQQHTKLFIENITKN